MLRRTKTRLEEIEHRVDELERERIERERALTRLELRVEQLGHDIEPPAELPCGRVPPVLVIAAGLVGAGVLIKLIQLQRGEA